MEKTRGKSTVNWIRLTKLSCLVLSIAAVIALAVPLVAQEDPATTIERFVLTDPVYTASVALGTEQSEIAFPAALTATMKDGSTKDVPVSWSCEGYDGESDGTYLFAASFTGYTYAKARPYAMVAVGNGGGAMAPMDAGAAEQSLTLTWTGGGTLDGAGVYQITPPENYTLERDSNVTLQLSYVLGGTVDAAPGEIEIRLPNRLFVKRDGSDVQAATVPLPLAPATGTGGFHYSIDPATDEIVITNSTTIASTHVFLCGISYNYGVPSTIQDGYTKAVQANATVTHAGATPEPLASNTLNLQFNTDAKLLYYGKAPAYTALLPWNSSWGTAPANAGDYLYQMFVVSHGSTLETTQPYTITLVDTPSNGGQVIGYAAEKEGPFLPSRTVQVTIPHDSGQLSDTYNTSKFTYVLVAYPKDQIPSGKDAMTNTATVYLTGVDGATDEKTVQCQWTAVYMASFTPPGRLFTNGKGIKGNNLGGITLLESGKPMVAAFTNNFTINGMPFTLEDGADPTVVENYGKKTYTVEHADADYIYLNGVRLEEGDYEIVPSESVRTIVYTYSYQPENYWKFELDRTVDMEVQVWIKTAVDGAWTQHGTIRQNSNPESYAYTFTDMGGTEYSRKMNLPAGLRGIKYIVTTNVDRLEFSYSLNVKIYPTPRVLAALASGAGTAVTGNFNTALVRNQEGTIVSPASTLTPEAADALIAAHDAQEYGQKVMHKYSFSEAERLQLWARAAKEAYSSENDAANTRVKLKFSLFSVTGTIYGVGNSYEDIRDTGFVPEQRSGTFYDLLPLGVVPDLSTVSVRMRGDYSTPYFDVQVTSVSLQPNWRGSGRTMMIVRVDTPASETRQNYNPYAVIGQSMGMDVSSGLELYFTAYYDWDSIADYGSVLTNHAAFRADTELGTGAYADSGNPSWDAALQSLFSDLDGDGNPEGTPANTTYMAATTTLNYVTSANLDFSKGVRTPGITSYDNGQTVPITATAGNTYTYRLRIGNAPNAYAKNMVFYDVLEAHNPAETNRWKGELVSFDISNPLSKGIDVVVYYSTVSGIGFTAGTVPNLAADPNWSTTPPKNLADVTAIAFDLSRDTSGNEYTLEPERTVSIYLTMRAPVEGVPALAASDACAYNSAWMSSTAWLKGGAESTQMVVYEYTKVHLREPELAIRKFSDPGSGTEEKPKRLTLGQNLDYTLFIENSSSMETFANLTVEDTIPDGLVVDVAGICYKKNYSGPWKPMDAGVSVTAEGQKLTFTVASFLPGQNIQLKIPTSQYIGNTTEMLFVNQAKITGYNGSAYLIESNKTYHDAAKNPIARIRVRKVVENYAADQAGQEFLIGLTGTGCNADTGLALKHNETSLPMIVMLPSASAQIAVRETVPMEYSLKSISASITHADGTTETQNGASFTVKPGDDVLITVTNTFSHDPFFKADGFVENRFGA